MLHNSEVEHLAYEGGGFVHPGMWWTLEGCLDAPENIPAGSMISNAAWKIGARRPEVSYTRRGQDWWWIVDPIVGDRVRVPYGVRF